MTSPVWRKLFRVKILSYNTPTRRVDGPHKSGVSREYQIHLWFVSGGVSIRQESLKVEGQQKDNDTYEPRTLSATERVPV